MNRTDNANAGITLAESVLLRRFGAPEKVLGPHYRFWIAFARHIDQMSSQDWERVAAAWTTARNASWEAAWAAAWDSEDDVVWDEAWAAAEDASWDAAEAAAGTEAAAEAASAVRDAAWEASRVALGDAARDAAEAAAWTAARELVGWSQLKEPFFLRMFFDDPQAWVKSIEDEDD